MEEEEEEEHDDDYNMMTIVVLQLLTTDILYPTILNMHGSSHWVDVSVLCCHRVVLLRLLDERREVAQGHADVGGEPGLKQSS